MLKEVAALLRAALTNIHRDHEWWLKVGIGGGLMLTFFGYPLAAGMVVESIDNSRKGYPTPLPPWFNWGTRYLVGLFALLIDLVFFILPTILVIIVLTCALMGVVIGGAGNPSVGRVLLIIALIVMLLSAVTLWLCSAAPVARLIFVEEGRIEEALGMEPLRRALDPRRRGNFWRARLASLAGYLPFASVAALLTLATRLTFPGQFAVLLLLLWLLLCALLYAHLVVAQVYVMAEQAAERAHIMNSRP